MAKQTSKITLEKLVEKHVPIDSNIRSEVMEHLRAYSIKERGARERDQLKYTIYNKILQEKIELEAGRIPWHIIEATWGGFDPVEIATALIDLKRHLGKDDPMYLHTIHSLSFLAAIQGDMQKVVAKNKEFITNKDFDSAQKNIKKFLKKMESQLDKMKNLPKEFKTNMRETIDALLQHDVLKQDKRNKGSVFASEAVDVLPYVGPMKMMSEAAAGKKMSGQKLSAKKRAMHFTEGLGFMALDVISMGSGGFIRAGKVMIKGSKYIGRAKKASTLAHGVQRMGTFFVKHADLLRRLETMKFQKLIKSTKKQTRKAYKKREKDSDTNKNTHA